MSKVDEAPDSAPMDGVKAKGTSQTSITVRWKPVGGASSYKVEASGGSMFSRVRLSWSDAGTTKELFHEVTDLAKCTTYNFRVTALDSKGNIVGKPSDGTLQATTLTVEEHNERLLKQVKKLQDTAAGRAQVREMGGQMDTMWKKLANHKAEVKTLTKDLKVTRAAHAAAELAKTNLSSKLAELRKQHTELAAKKETAANAAKQAAAESAQRIQELTEQLDATKAELEGSRKSAEAAAQAAEEQVEELRLQNGVDVAARHVAEQTAEEAKEAAAAAAEAAAKQKAEHDAQVEELQATITDLTTQLEGVKQTLAGIHAAASGVAK